MELEKSKFEEWLKSFPPKEIIGNMMSVKGCVIANYLGNGAVVGFTAWARESHSELLPSWATDFIFHASNSYERERMSAGKALQILDRIKD